jgi:hypothetical protein
MSNDVIAKVRAGGGFPALLDLRLGLVEEVGVFRPKVFGKTVTWGSAALHPRLSHGRLAALSVSLREQRGFFCGGGERGGCRVRALGDGIY